MIESEYITIEEALKKGSGKVNLKFNASFLKVKIQKFLKKLKN